MTDLSTAPEAGYGGAVQQLEACRAYLKNRLGHIPEVRKLIADIENTLREAPTLRGVAHSPAGLPLVSVTITGDQAFVQVPSSFDPMSDLAKKLNVGITVNLKKHIEP